MKKSVPLFAFLLTSLLFSNIAFAQWELGSPFSVVDLWTGVLGLPEDWFAPQPVIFNVIIPFVAIFAICLGFLRTLRIFERVHNIQIVIAFAMAFMTMPTKAFMAFVSFTLGLGGMWAYVLFIAMFIGGAAIYTGGFFYRSAGEAGLYATYKKERDRMEKQLGSIWSEEQLLWWQLTTAKPSEIPNIKKKLAELTKRREELEMRKREMKRAYQDIV